MNYTLRQVKQFLSKDTYDQLLSKRARCSDADNTSDPAADVEPNSCRGQMETKENTRFYSPVYISIHSVRGKLADPDGISGKAAIDGLVKSGVLADDSSKFVKEVRFTQDKCHKGEEERTVITIEVIR